MSELARHVLDGWPLARKQTFQSAFDLLAKVIFRKLLLQLGFQLGCHRRQEISVIGEKSRIHVGFVEYQHVLYGFVFHRALKVFFIDCPVHLGPLKFHSLRMNWLAGTAPGNGEDPRETDVDQHRGLFLMGQ